MMEEKRKEDNKKVQEKENILRVLKSTLSAVKREDTVELKLLSNKVLHTASIQQDIDNVAVAVIVYSLGKIIERKKYTSYKEWPKFYKNYLLNIKNAIKNLESNDAERFRQDLQNIQTEINKLSGKFKKYIKDVFRKAEINKASRIYEHGISMQQTASLLGITLWELAEYAGQTGISDVNLTVTMPIEKRLKQAQEIFK